MISQNIEEGPLNITSILNNFKSFIKQVYQIKWAQILQRNLIKIIISEKKKVKSSKSYLHLKIKSRMTFNNGESLIYFKYNSYQRQFRNTYNSYKKLAIIFDIKTLKLF